MRSAKNACLKKKLHIQFVYDVTCVYGRVSVHTHTHAHTHGSSRAHTHTCVIHTRMPKISYTLVVIESTGGWGGERVGRLARGGVVEGVAARVDSRLLAARLAAACPVCASIDCCGCAAASQLRSCCKPICNPGPNPAGDERGRDLEAG